MTKQKGEHTVVEGVLLGGSNILWIKGLDDDEIDLEDDKLMRRTVTRKEWEQELAIGLLIPLRLLKVSYPKGPDIPKKLKVPYRWTVEVKPPTS